MEEDHDYAERHDVSDSKHIGMEECHTDGALVGKLILK